MSELRRCLEAATLAARVGGSIHRHFWSADDLEVERKSGIHDVATKADRLAERAVASFLATTDVPRVGVIGEEALYRISARGGVAVVPYAPGARHNPQNGWRRPRHRSYWLVDGLDGTSNYERGIPIFGISVAYVHEGVPVVGAVYSVISDELFAVHRGGAPTVNGVRLRHTRPIPSTLGDLVIDGASQPVRLKASVPGPRPLVRAYGSPVVALAYVAAGRLDAYRMLRQAPARPQRTGPWDLAAGALLVQAAGGWVSGPRGEPFDLWDGGILATRAPEIHARLLRDLA